MKFTCVRWNLCYVCLLLMENVVYLLLFPCIIWFFICDFYGLWRCFLLLKCLNFIASYWEQMDVSVICCNLVKRNFGNYYLIALLISCVWLALKSMISITIVSAIEDLNGLLISGSLSVLWLKFRGYSWSYICHFPHGLF